MYSRTNVNQGPVYVEIRKYAVPGNTHPYPTELVWNPLPQCWFVHTLLVCYSLSHTSDLFTSHSSFSLSHSLALFTLSLKKACAPYLIQKLQ